MISTFFTKSSETYLLRPPLNVNEKQLVEELLTRVLGEDLEVELLAADSQFESQAVFQLLEALKISHIIAWRRLNGRDNPPCVLTVKDRIDVKDPEWKKVIYKRLRVVVQSFNGRAKRGGLGMDGCRRGHHAFTSLAEALCGIGSPLLTAVKSVLTRIYL